MKTVLEHPNQPEILALIEQLDEYQKPLYPAESHHGIDISALCAMSAIPRATSCICVSLWPESIRDPK